MSLEGLLKYNKVADAATSRAFGTALHMVFKAVVYNR
jgi:hypothetical protein